jgi:hypothetical protein
MLDDLQLNQTRDHGAEQQSTDNSCQHDSAKEQALLRVMVFDRG